MSRLRLSYRVIVLSWGMMAIMMQSILLRESQVLMFGCEFTWGIVLSSWLLGIAVGGAIGGRLAPRLACPHKILSCCLLSLGCFAMGELFLFRMARGFMSLQTGEMPSLCQTAFLAFCLVSPFSLLIGLSFPLACRISETRSELSTKSKLGPLANVYGLESAGSLLGGAVFSFWAVDHLSATQIILNMLAITSLVVGWLFMNLHHIRTGRILCGAAICAVLLATFTTDPIDRRLLATRWNSIAPDYTVLIEKDSKLQNLAILERAQQYSLFCDGHVTADFPDPWTYTPTAHLKMCEHPSPEHILVLGGGAEGLLAELVKWPVDTIDYLEPDPQVMDVLIPFLTETDRQALNDPRVNIYHKDPRHFIKTRNDNYDLVIARLPDPTSALRARYFTVEFYRELRNAMTDTAVLGFSIPAAPGELDGPLLVFVSSITRTLEQVFPEVIVGWSDPAQVLASTSTGMLTLNPGTLISRYEASGVTSNHFYPAWFEGATDWLDTEKIAQRKAEIGSCETATVSTDDRPIVYMQRLASWDRMMHSNQKSLFETLQTIPEWFVYVICIGGTIAMSFLLSGRHSKGNWRGCVLTSITVTGFVSMGLSIAWLFAFQNLYGYVYQRIGWIIALFMAGLVAGCWWVQKRVNQRPYQHSLFRMFILTDIAIALLSAGLPCLLHWLHQVPPHSLWVVELSVSCGVCLTGYLCGSAFAFAGGLSMSEGESAAATSGMIVAGDHAGACLGAILTGVVLIPVFGIATTAGLFACMKMTTAVNSYLRTRATHSPPTA